MLQVIPCIGWTITSWSPLTNPNVGIIVPETCGTIYKILQIEYFTIIYYINVNNTTYWVTWCIIYIFIYLGHKYLVSIICNVVAGLTNILNIVDACIIVVASILILKEQCVEQLFIINELQTIYVSKDGSKHIFPKSSCDSAQQFYKWPGLFRFAR